MCTNEYLSIYLFKVIFNYNIYIIFISAVEIPCFANLNVYLVTILNNNISLKTNTRHKIRCLQYLHRNYGETLYWRVSDIISSSTSFALGIFFFLKILLVICHPKEGISHICWGRQSSNPIYLERIKLEKIN